ncbi:putative 39S ribosomal protein L35, mitochondrial precursor-like [Ditylenchus destructor]|nr:putative 39S ribosomal protein L35, mitochondrial precursor-like [Ditylenchus destructor]
MSLNAIACTGRFGLLRSTLGCTVKHVNQTAVTSSRTIINIPHWEYHIRFDPKQGRKRPCQDVLDRFKRLNNGMWVRSVPGNTKQRYSKADLWRETSFDWYTCTKEECSMLDKMMSPFWLRRKHYVDDILEPYHTRHGINSPRVDDKKRFVRERPKVLLDDSTADKYFFDR